jgi:murein DD-endopeptidase MepM/ murein hydrolase activator NlpD
MRFTTVTVCVAFIFLLASTLKSKTETVETADIIEEVSGFDALEKSASYRLEPDLDEFGVHANAYNRESGYFSKRESVYGLLEQKGLDRLRIHEVATALKVLFDPSKIYPSQRYFIYTAKSDTSANPIVAKLIIEKNEQEFVRAEFENDIHVLEASRVVQRLEKVVEGVIERSLYHTLVDQKLPYDLLWKLEQVYDWKVDFNRLQKGDRFKLVVEELIIGDRSIGIGDILASEFEHKGDVFKAYKFNKNGLSSYYDQNGVSLAKAILQAPLKYTRVSSRFSNSRMHPVLKRRMPHHGVDFAAPSGTPVVSAGDGQVMFAKYKGVNGNYVRIKHNGTYETAYLHLRNFAKGIKSGTKVKQGQVIGYVGSTGRSTGPHLDYRVFKNGKAVNPFSLDLPSNDKLEMEEYQRFKLTSLTNYDKSLSGNF